MESVKNVLAKFVKVTSLKKNEIWNVTSAHVVCYFTKISSNFKIHVESYEDFVIVPKNVMFDVKLKILENGNSSKFFVLTARRNLKILRNLETILLKSGNEIVLLTEDIVKLEKPNRELTFKDQRNLKKSLDVYANRFIAERNHSLGQGFSGSVIPAFDSMNPFMPYALKIFDMSDQETSRDVAISSIREINMLKKIRHPNIIRLFEEIENSTKTIVVLDLMDSDLVKDLQTPYPESKARDALMQVLHALEYMHSLGFAHNDIKCDNILIKRLSDGSSIYKLCDFGSATPDIQKTEFQFTYIYVSPEMLSFNENRGEFSRIKSDMFSFGVVAFAVLTEKLPFDDTKEEDDHTNRMNGKFNDKRLKKLKFSARLFVSQLLKANPEMRLTAKSALEHNWFKSQISDVISPPESRFPLSEIQNVCIKKTISARRSVRIAVTREKILQTKEPLESRNLTALVTGYSSKIKSRRPKMKNRKRKLNCNEYR